MKFAIALQPEVDEKWHLAKQMGLEHAVGISHPGAGGPLWDYATCVRTKKLYKDFGFTATRWRTPWPGDRPRWRSSPSTDVFR